VAHREHVTELRQPDWRTDDRSDLTADSRPRASNISCEVGLLLTAEHVRQSQVLYM
jgi:hypothetical protein